MDSGKSILSKNFGMMAKGKLVPVKLQEDPKNFDKPFKVKDQQGKIHLMEVSDLTDPTPQRALIHPCNLETAPCGNPIVEDGQVRLSLEGPAYTRLKKELFPSSEEHTPGASGHSDGAPAQTL